LDAAHKTFVSSGWPLPLAFFQLSPRLKETPPFFQLLWDLAWLSLAWQRSSTSIADR
jgi:hypothetical protein